LRPTASHTLARHLQTATLLFLALGGGLVLVSCMRIYEDPDLPDLRVIWSEDQCPEGGMVSVQLMPSGEITGGQSVASAPCSDLRVIVENVDRAKLRVVGVISDPDGTVVTQDAEQVDTTDGNNKEAYLSFQDSSFGQYRMAWSFVPGASCATVGATYVSIEFTLDDKKTFAEFFPCSDGTTAYDPSVEAGTYTIRVFALLLSGPRLASSPPLVDIAISPRGELTDLGLVELKPCVGPCAL
jgi:hypothetical protein